MDSGSLKNQHPVPVQGCASTLRCIETMEHKLRDYPVPDFKDAAPAKSSDRFATRGALFKRW